MEQQHSGFSGKVVNGAGKLDCLLVYLGTCVAFKV